MHKKDEYVQIDKLLLAAKIYAKAIYRLAAE
jgi:acetylornithine deacetylase/succinyl-diaminopimelate desuccinylase-like protein